MKTKKLISFATVIVMILTVFTGCTPANNGGNGNSDYVMDPVLNPLGSETICKETVDLKIMIAQDGNVQDYDTNKYTKEVERKGNVNLKFNLVPQADAETKINLTLSAGEELPDILIYNMSDANVSTYGEAGVILPLNQYYENSSEYLVPQAEELLSNGGLDVIKYITMADGNIYTIPQYNESLMNEFQTVLWIYKPWLDKIGMKVPETLDDLKTVLRAFKDNDVNGNGNKSDEIPMVDCTSNNVIRDIEQAFVHTGEDELTIRKDGSLAFAYATDEYKEFLKYMRDLVTNGLYDITSFSQDAATLKTLLNTPEPRVGVFSYTSTSVLSSAKNRRLEYVPIMLKGPNYNTTYYRKTMPTNRFFITRACEHPEVAFRIGDYMCSKEMTVWSRFGEKGVDWKEPAEGTEALYDFLGYKPTIESILMWGSSQNSHWQNNTPGFRTTDVVLGVAASNDDSQRSKADAIKLMYDEIPEYGTVVEKIIYTPEELDERTQIKTGIDSYVAEMMFNFMTGKTDIDSGWDKYIKELTALNIDRLLEISQTAYDRMN